MRIPLSQLRFTSADKQTWGINVERYIRRRNEGSWLEMVPKKETGRASRMVHLTGLDGLKPSRRLELLPYTAGRAEYVAPASTVNPFNDGSRLFASAGLDMKYGLTSNLTVDATVNPDFGQVEVDPAVVNLSAFETFFEEKRAFFLEGAQIFNNFGRGGSNGNWGFNNSEPQIFYSRRIGRVAAAPARCRVRRSADGHDDPRRREADRQDRTRMEHRPARGHHQHREGADADRIRAWRSRRRADDQLRGRPTAARYRSARRSGHAGDDGQSAHHHTRRQRDTSR